MSTVYAQGEPLAPAGASGSRSASGLYNGTLMHQRLDLRREFKHPLSLFYLDLDELPELLGGRLVRPSFGTLRWRRQDYHGDGGSLAEAVKDTVEREIGTRPQGPVRVLTQVRTFGHSFNPVSFYYCFAADGQTLAAVLAEVTNTPWGERHAYVIAGGEGTVEKAMHVSPFMQMDYEYRFRAPAPGEHLSVRIENLRDGERAFEASISMRRTQLDAPSARGFLRRYPLASLRVLALIYGHAAALKLAGARHYPHPERSRS